MAAIVWTDVTNADSTLTAVNANHQTEILSWVNDEALNVDALGGETSTNYKLARIYLAAHLGTLATPAGSAGGPVKKEKVGDLEIEFSVSSAAGGSYASTRWGKLYLTLIKRSPGVRGPWVF